VPHLLAAYDAAWAQCRRGRGAGRPGPLPRPAAGD